MDTKTKDQTATAPALLDEPAERALAMKLAQFAALLDVLEEKAPISDPAGWMELTLPIAAGYFIRPLDLYLDGHIDALMDLAESRLEAYQVLDQVRPNWRDDRSAFEVFQDVDGARSIRPREQ